MLALIASQLLKKSISGGHSKNVDFEWRQISLLTRTSLRFDLVSSAMGPRIVGGRPGWHLAPDNSVYRGVSDVRAPSTRSLTVPLHYYDDESDVSNDIPFAFRTKFTVASTSCLSSLMGD